jgi:coenzyme F420-0:L-glutamate ligase/coenzyme F420-1:gamma-L-glutamate ligase
MEVIPVHLRGNVTPDDNVADLILSAVRKVQSLRDGDILVVAHKIVSKAEGRIVSLNKVKPSRRAVSIARKHGKDPRIVELILRESRRIVKMKRGIIITETNHGLVCANAGVDRSNVNGNNALLLPINPDRSAEAIRSRIRRQTGKNIAVIISDTFGRPFREGQVNVAIGIAGLKPMMDYRGTRDMFGRKLQVTVIATADEIASAAELVMGKRDHMPIAIVRGLAYGKNGSADELIRKPKDDLFR